MHTMIDVLVACDMNEYKCIVAELCIIPTDFTIVNNLLDKLIHQIATSVVSNKIQKLINVLDLMFCCFVHYVRRLN